MWFRILAVGIIGFAGMGAVAALARDPAPAPTLEYPVAERAKKADRLSLVPEQRTVRTITSAPAVQPAPIASVPQPPALQTKTVLEPPAPVVASHRGEAIHSSSKKRKRLASTKQSQAAQVEKPIRTVDCSGNGLDGLLRSMRLKPGCL